MAKEKEVPADDPKEWTPDQPIPDEDGEGEAQRRHMLNRRLAYLNDEAEKKSKSGKKKTEDIGKWRLG